MKKYIVASIALFVFLLSACGGNDERQDAVIISEEEKVDDEKVVAIVNGEEITGATYNLVYTQLKLHASQFNEEVDENEIKEATIESVIDRQLVFQAARDIGIEYTDEDVNDELDEIKTSNEETFETLLQQYQLTEDAFKEQLKFELTMNDYIRDTISVDVEDDELEDYYEKAKEGNDEIPEFDEIKDQIKKQVLQDKTNEAFEEQINSIKEKATIEQKL